MSRRCAGCTHPQRATLSSEYAAGTPYRELAEQFGLSLAALSRHRPHAEVQIARAIEVRQAVEVETVGDDIARQRADLERLAKEMVSGRDLRGAAQVKGKLLDTAVRIGEIASGQPGRTLTIEFTHLSPLKRFEPVSGQPDAPAGQSEENGDE